MEPSIFDSAISVAHDLVLEITIILMILQDLQFGKRNVTTMSQRDVPG